MRVMLTRHGQTQSNIELRLDTRPPGAPLTGEGQRQALELAERLAGDPIAAVYASRAIRAQQTGEPLAGKLGHEIGVLDGVHEVAAGELEDRSDRDALVRYQEVCLAWSRGELDVAMPGAETGHEFIGRYQGTLDELRDRHAGELVVVVSHGAAIRLAAGHLADNVDSERSGLALLPNTGQVVLEATANGWHCLSWPEVELS
ncbi:histidine phosphatase family protein [Sciscionella sediminilitoris]|uniref:histidine phosphatase family protein n=1 Tax=Sciscionella sediminilitoris TaxID=1445613 RepID=UPI0004DF68BA|nr:histidine phosphatase family protein [Sciscionella sp. SE31]